MTETINNGAGKQNAPTRGAGRIPAVPFTKEMRKDYTILIPMMAPIHFSLVKNVLSSNGYQAELLENCGPGVVEEGLKYVHNDTCYPALLVIGQMLDALKSGKYDLNKTALMISQTGGGCRASNYIFLLRRALKKAGYDQIPVVSLNVSGLEKNSGFRFTPSMLYQALAGLTYGDGLMALSNQVKPYEMEKGSAGRLVKDWVLRLGQQFQEKKGGGRREMKANFRRIAAEFAAIPMDRKPKVRVGIVGEIYVKYASLGNNNLEDFLARQDCEVMVPGLLDFVLYTVNAVPEKSRLYGGGAIKALTYETVSQYIQSMQNIMIEAIAAYPEFVAPSPFAHTKALTRGVISTGCDMGEGWLLTAEMVELIQKGYGNIVCTQPFGCLPNHICGKGMIRKIRQLDPRANIVPIDYDPSATRVNQENRIKLMLAVARENLAKQGEGTNTPCLPETAAPKPLSQDLPYSKWRRLHTEAAGH
jgi:predicted nucleotide-binding protein (sugar kinase/HSP70/actin superfamily)